MPDQLLEAVGKAARSNVQRVFKILAAVAVVLLALALFGHESPRWLIGAAAEWAVALVIYYEIEESRGTEFLEQAMDKESIRTRAELYESFTELDVSESATLAERAKVFEEKLWAEKELRAKFDYEWGRFARLHYGVRNSFLHRKLIAKWFPQVMISFWAMGRPYVLAFMSARGNPAPHVQLLKAVKLSLEEYRDQNNGFRSISILSPKSKMSVRISVDELQTMLEDLKNCPQS
jgi:hypothetical protein